MPSTCTCTCRAHAEHVHRIMQMHMHMPCTCRTHAHAYTMQVSFATLPDVLEHAAGAIHLAIGKDSEGRDELFVSQVEVVSSG